MSSLLRHRLRRTFSSSAAAILSPSDPSAVLSTAQKSRSALSLLKTSTDPTKILSICSAAALHPSSHSDRLALSLAIYNLNHKSKPKSSSKSHIQTLISSLLLQNPNPKSISHAIVLFGQASMLDSSLSLFNSSPHSTKNLNSLLFAAILAKNHHSVIKFFRDYSTIDPDVETYNLVIKSFSESGTTASAYSLLDEMRNRNLQPSTTTFNYMIAGFYREERLEEVDKVVDLMKKKYRSFPGLSTYNERILSLCKLGRTKEAEVLLDEMTTKGMKTNWVSYGNLIVGFCKEKELEEAKRVYGEMKRKGFVAESGCYFSLIHYLTKVGDYEAALGVVKEVVGRNWVPCFKTMKKLVKGLAKRGKGEEAKELVGMMKERFPGKEEKWKPVEEALPQ